MRVLLTHELFPPDFGGGGEYIVMSTARHLQQRGFDVRVVTTGDPALREFGGVPTTRLPIHRYRLNTAVWALMPHVRQADIVHTFNYHACLPSLICARMAGKPVVCLMLGLFGCLWREMSGPVTGRMRQLWERFLLRSPFERTLFLSSFSRDLAVDLGIRPERAVVNEPGIELTLYEHDDVKEDVVMFSGKLEYRKGVDDVIAVARALPHVRFRVLGWGARKAEIQSVAPPNIEWGDYPVGPASEGLAREFRRSRIFLFPSRGETFGLVIAEAMAAGCAVVSSVPLDFEGAAITPGDVDGIARAVDRLWHDRQLTAEVGRNNRNKARRFSWERHVDHLQKVYHDVLEPGGERHLTTEG
jgi:glycosyltransferase involved in cell wall biosynthesis